MADIWIRGVTKAFDRVEVLRGVDLDVADGAFAVLLGPSGCGKSTLLRLIAGLEEPTGGAVRIDGRSVAGQNPGDRGCAMVLQNDTLYPHLTVVENIGHGLGVAHPGADERNARVEEAAKIVELGDLLDRKPGELTAAERLRVILARAIIGAPGLLLFDEPLSSLDLKLRAQLRHEIRRVHDRVGATSVLVTQDQAEAIALADLLVVMRAGRIEQVGTPAEIHASPVNIHVAEAVGAPPMNFLHGWMDDTGVRVALSGGAVIDLAARIAVQPGKAVIVGIRPEALGFGDGDCTLSGVFDVVEVSGGCRLYHLEIDGRHVTMQSTEVRSLVAGEQVPLSIDAGALHLFDPVTERRIESVQSPVRA